jgi:magnesium chelatase subunit H
MRAPVTAEERDRMVLRLYEELLEIEQRLIPTGLHVFGEAPTGRALADLLQAVAAFDRPELGLRSLPGLVAEGLGLPPYVTLLAPSGSGQRLAEREAVDAIVKEAIAEYLDRGREAASTLLAARAGVAPAEAQRVFDFLDGLREQLAVNREQDALVRALRGEYIEPGPGADLVQNPRILPTGRNTHAVNPYAVPSRAAFERAKTVVARLLERCRAELGRYPAAIGMVLWGMDNIKTQGEGVAQALWLMGVEPVRDAMNRATDVRVVSLEELGRPRIDVVMTVSGIFRDLFGATVELLEKAVLRVAGLPEPGESNFLALHTREQQASGSSFEEAAARIFSNAAGSYGTNVNFMVLDSQWQRPEELGELFLTRKSFAFGRGIEGRPARQLLERALARVEVTYQNLDNAEIGLTDVDHYFEYLGGLTRAAELRAGRRPNVYLSDALTPAIKIRTLEETIRLETRTKILNPKWQEGMLRHGYRGVAEIENHVANTFGWSATADAVDNWVYDEIAGAYVLDSGMLARLRSLNPHATRSLVGRLLEAAGRGFWNTSAATVERLRQIHGLLEDELEGVAPARR